MDPQEALTKALHRYEESKATIDTIFDDNRRSSQNKNKSRSFASSALTATTTTNDSIDDERMSNSHHDVEKGSSTSNAGGLMDDFSNFNIAPALAQFQNVEVPTRRSTDGYPSTIDAKDAFTTAYLRYETAKSGASIVDQTSASIRKYRANAAAVDSIAEEGIAEKETDPHS